MTITLPTKLVPKLIKLCVYCWCHGNFKKEHRDVALYFGTCLCGHPDVFGKKVEAEMARRRGDVEEIVKDL